MFVGHYGAAFLAKGAQPKAPLWALFLAAQWVDVLWAILVLTGIERARFDASLPGMPVDLEHMPFTHSLVASAIWGTLGVLAARWGFGWSRGVAAATGATVASHWFLDLPVHRPDLPLVWGEPRLGFGLWDHPLAALALEVGWLLATVAFVTRAGALDAATRTRVRRLAAGLVALQLATTFGPTPQSLLPLVWIALVAYLAIPILAAPIEARDRAYPSM
jgi:hypothetical protein